MMSVIRRNPRIQSLAPQAVALILVTMTAGAAAQPPHYTVTPIGSTFGYQTGGEAINNRGEVVGLSRPYAFLYSGGQIRNLGTLYPDDQESWAFDINDSGVAVGYSAHDDDFGFRAVRWSNGTVIDLGNLGFPESGALGINNAGQIVGGSRLATGQGRGFLWENGVMSDLGTLGGNESYATAINDLGQVVGSAQTTAGWLHPFLWQNGSMTDLGLPAGATGAYPEDISGSGGVAGYAVRPGFVNVPVLWDGTGPHELASLGGVEARALGINGAGRIVGFSWTTQGEPRALLWQDDMMYDLNDLVPTPYRGRMGGATAINDLGQIVVQDNEWITQTYVLTPVPEACTFSNMFAAVILWTITPPRRPRRLNGRTRCWFSVSPMDEILKGDGHVQVSCVRDCRSANQRTSGSTAICKRATKRCCLGKRIVRRLLSCRERGALRSG